MEEVDYGIETFEMLNAISVSLIGASLLFIYYISKDISETNTLFLSLFCLLIFCSNYLHRF